MGGRTTHLPFPRGSTLMEFKSSVTQAEVAGSLHLIGNRYEVEDELWGLGWVELTVVQAGAALTAAAAWTTAVSPPITFSSPITSRGWRARPKNVQQWLTYNRQVDTLPPASTGIKAALLDDYYAHEGRTQTIAQYDLLYVVSRGPCLALTNATTGLDGGDTVVALASGTLGFAVAEPASGSPNQYVLGSVYGTLGSDAYQTLDSLNFCLVLVDHFAGYHGGSL